MNYLIAPQNVKRLIDDIIEIEGGFTDHKYDRGGATKYGITKNTALRHGYNGDMRDLPLSLAQDIYAREYFFMPKLDLIWSVSEKICQEVFDSGVNIGVNRSVRILQDTLNLLNRDEQDYYDLVVDGLIGSKTQKALMSYLDKRGKKGGVVLYNLLNCQQAYYYMDICRHDRTQENWLYGWATHRLKFL